MEDQTMDGGEPEEFSDSFLCCVCLDLLYKPIVLSCGHISCFWCVHRSMNSLRDSHCPICRHPYNYFPTVCQMLHFLLLKMYPIAYKNRENQILEEEKTSGYFSPQFDGHACGPHADKEFNHMGDSAHSCTTGSESYLCSDPWCSRIQDPCVTMEQLESVPLTQDNSKTIPNQTFNGNCKHVSIADVLCAACKQLLFRPVVINCGHAYCEMCIINPADKMLRCQVCQSLHPRGFPKVCLELEHFLEEHFPKEYALRRDAVQVKQVQFKHEIATACSNSIEVKEQGFFFSSAPEGDELPWWADPSSKVHLEVGCDSCGMYPIIGDRYKCKDCMEAIGFDLCGDCYNTRSKLPGRFNQQHTPEHRFELVESNVIRNVMLIYRQLVNRSTALVIPGDASESSENGSPPTLSVDAQENSDSDLNAHVTDSDNMIDQNDTQSTSEK